MLTVVVNVALVLQVPRKRHGLEVQYQQLGCRVLPRSHGLACRCHHSNTIRLLHAVQPDWSVTSEQRFVACQKDTGKMAFSQDVLTLVVACEVDDT